jgi:hypothetical protein
MPNSTKVRCAGTHRVAKMLLLLTSAVLLASAPTLGRQQYDVVYRMRSRGRSPRSGDCFASRAAITLAVSSWSGIVAADVVA